MSDEKRKRTMRKKILLCVFSHTCALAHFKSLQISRSSLFFHAFVLYFDGVLSSKTFYMHFHFQRQLTTANTCTRLYFSQFFTRWSFARGAEFFCVFARVFALISSAQKRTDKEKIPSAHEFLPTVENSFYFIELCTF